RFSRDWSSDVCSSDLGDEFNQTWKISLKGTDVFGFNLQIFNRWGEPIWESNDPSIGWDGTYNGKVVPTGTYVWRASMKNKNDDEIGRASCREREQSGV